MFVSDGEIHRCRADVDGNADVGPDERIRALADVAILKVLALVAAVLAFFAGIAIAGKLLLVLMPIIDGSGIAVATAWLAVALSMSLPVAAVQVGRRLQRRRLRRALRIASDRRHTLVGNVSAGGASVAVSATPPLRSR